MNRLRDPQGRFIKVGKAIDISANFSRGSNTPTTNSPERYRKAPEGSNSTQKPKENLPRYITKGTIEGEGTFPRGPEDVIPKQIQRDQPLVTSTSPLVTQPKNTTFSLVGSPNFVYFVDPEQVKALFGNPLDIVISQIETSTVEPTFPLGFKKMVDQGNISPEIECWDAPLSPQKELPRYIYIKNLAYRERRL